MTQYWCSYCEQVGVSGDHECEPKGVEEFLGWLRERYRAHEPMTFQAVAYRWWMYCSNEPFSVHDHVVAYLRYLQDITGEVVCDTSVYPPVYYPRGMEAERKTREGLQQHHDAAVRLATTWRQNAREGG